MKLILIICAILGTALPSSLHCQDDGGNNVDWYVVYKIPKEFHLFLKSSELRSGTRYMFITNDTVDKGWTVSTKNMADPTSIIARTIENMYKNRNEEIWLAYNDQSPTEGVIESIIKSWRNNYLYGHTKGVLGATSEGGFWLVHSFPHFPKLDSYSYPHNTLRNGQSALCITLSPEELDKVGNAFKYNFPHFEKNQFSSELGAKYPTLKEAAAGNKAEILLNKTFNITSKGGVAFQIFAKTKSYGKDLYEWLASTLDTDMYAETWQLEPSPLGSSCSINRKVMNVHSILFKPANLHFNSKKDHSKWAISASLEKPYVCIGDINRALPQEKRGGGTVCIKNERLWNAYNSIISDKDSC